MVKVYPDGQMSQFLEHMQIGDTLWVAGPKGKYKYCPLRSSVHGGATADTSTTRVRFVTFSVIFLSSS